MQHNTRNRTTFTYGNHPIENVNTYKYLGHVLCSNKSIHRSMPTYIASQAKKALFALQSKSKPKLGYITPPLALKMFDTYILPILEYGSPIWSKVGPIQDLEKIQLGYLKTMLGVRKQTPTLAIYAETGRFPLHIRQMVDIMKYWERLKNFTENDILKRCLNIQTDLHNKGQTNWYSKVQSIIENSGIASWDALEAKTLVKHITLNLYDKEQKHILDEINNSDKHPKLRSYKLFKEDYRLEPYLSLNLSRKTYINIARFRTSSHNLKIETGRHEVPKVPAENRLCEKCNQNAIEDELHCLLNCDSHNTQREELLRKASLLIPHFGIQTKLNQFKLIMSSREQEIIKSIGNFLNKSL